MCQTETGSETGTSTVSPKTESQKREQKGNGSLRERGLPTFRPRNGKSKVTFVVESLAKGLWERVGTGSIGP